MSLTTAPASAAKSLTTQLEWHNGFAALGTAFYTEVAATALPAPYLVAVSSAVAADLGLDAAQPDSPEFLALFSGNQVAGGSKPLATVYSGHQFGHWAGQLGDGRALLLGELASKSGAQEVQLKGAGATPYSRMGDGRAVLRSSIREFLCSEAMAALGIATTRALCVIGSPLPVRRETLETAAVVARTASSFIRFGHFEHFANADDPHLLRQLADYVIGRYYPDCAGAPNPYSAFLAAVTLRTADLMAAWQAVGFCHGVMNTDNMSIHGLTIDYGPFGFMEAFDPSFICNHSDTHGRYAYGKQPGIGVWNCFALGQALMPLIGDSDAAVAALDGFKTRYPEQLNRRFAAKLGLSSCEPADSVLIHDLLRLMAQDQTDFTQFFRALSTPGKARDLLIDRDAFDAWDSRYQARLLTGADLDITPKQRALAMSAVNPKYVLRNYLAEVAIRKAQQGDLSEVRRLLSVLQRPFDDQPEFESYSALPPDWARHLEVSCSS